MARAADGRTVRRRCLAALAGAVAIASVALGTLALEGDSSAPARRAPKTSRSGASLRRREFITAELIHSVRRGLRFLILEQKETNSFRTGSYPVAVNGLVGLALLAGGNTSEESEKEDYAKAVEHCTATILSYQNADGYFDDGAESGMYGHGFATLFLAEVYGHNRGREKEVRAALRSAVRLIERAQHREGGWDYQPFQTRGRNGSDTSITVCQTIILRAARNLGLKVDPLIIQKARRYIENAQNADGGFRYRSEDIVGMAGSAFPRSAAGVCILHSLGDYNSNRIQRGIAYLERHYRYKTEFPFYAHYYCAQALFQVGGEKWQSYFRWIRERLLEDQHTDGSWRAKLFQVEKNPHQTTAMALIVLQLPYHLLPIHER